MMEEVQSSYILWPGYLSVVVLVLGVLLPWWASRTGAHWAWRALAVLFGAAVFTAISVGIAFWNGWSIIPPAEDMRHNWQWFLIMLAGDAVVHFVIWLGIVVHTVRLLRQRSAQIGEMP